MTATTTKPVYRWVDCIGGSSLYSDSNEQTAAEVYRDCVDEWHWRKIGDRESLTSFATIAAAKAACERALGVTTEPEGAKGQEDRPKVLPFYWDHIRDNLSALNGTNGSRLAIVNFDGAWNHWFWNPMGDPKGAPFNRTFKTEGEAKSSCEQFFYAKAAMEDQPPVIIPPNGLADALDSHAAKVAEEDAEARHAEVMVGAEPARCPICDWPLAKNVSEGCVLGNCAHRPRIDKDAEAKHAEAMNGKSVRRTFLHSDGIAMAAEILSVKLGVRVSPAVLIAAIELASEEI